MDGALGDQATAGDLLLFEPEGMQPEHFFELAHTEPYLRQSESSTFQWKPLPPAQLAELFLMKPVRDVDCHSDLSPVFDRHRVGIIIDMTSESLSTSVRNRYRHRPESTYGAFTSRSTIGWKGSRPERLRADD
jgi:hypothetical protein